MYRVVPDAIRLAARPGRSGILVGPGSVTAVPTRICITAVNGGAGVDTGMRELHPGLSVECRERSRQSHPPTLST
jgi:hypothetical protein